MDVIQVLAIAKKIESKHAGGPISHARSDAATVSIATRASVSPGSHAIDAAPQQGKAAQPGIQWGEKAVLETNPFISVSEAVIGHDTREANAALEDDDDANNAASLRQSNSGFFMANWVGTISPPLANGEDISDVALPKFRLVSDLDSPEDNIPLHALAPFIARMNASP